MPISLQDRRVDKGQIDVKKIRIIKAEQAILVYFLKRLRRN